MAYRFNPPPGWPSPPVGWIPSPDWRPDPAWPPAPPGWEFYVDEGSILDGFIADPNNARTARPWYKKKRYLIPSAVLGLVALFSAIPDRTPGPIAVADGSVPNSHETTASKAVPEATGTPSGRASAKSGGSKARKAKKKAAQKGRAASPSARAVASKPKRTPKPKKTATPKCDPNYSQACVPIASDVDCGGGSGNGPKFFFGIAKVIGADIYDLDRDGDGYACEPT